MKAVAPHVKKLAYATMTALSIGMMVGPGVAAAAGEVSKVFDNDQPDQSANHNRPVRRARNQPRRSQKTVNQEANQPETATLTRQEVRPVDEVEQPIPAPTPTFEPGQRVSLTAGDAEHELIVSYDDDQPLDTLLVQGQPPTYNPDSEVTVLGIHFGYRNEIDPQTGQYIPLAGTDVNAVLSQGLPIELRINGQNFRFVPAPVEPEIMTREEFNQGGYDHIKNLMTQKGVIDKPGQPATAVRTCAGRWEDADGFTDRIIYFGRLVPIKGS